MLNSRESRKPLLKILEETQRVIGRLQSDSRCDNILWVESERLRLQAQYGFDQERRADEQYKRERDLAANKEGTQPCAGDSTAIAPYNG